MFSIDRIAASPARLPRRRHQPTLRGPAAAALLAAAVGTFALPALAVQDCDIAGVSVNPGNGATSAGKSGIMRCVERDTGVVQREQELRNGQFIGLVRYYQNGKLEREFSVNAQGNREGVGKDFSPATGKLVREADYRNGTPVGFDRSYYPDGARRRVAWRDPAGKELAYVEFTPAGKLRDLRCGDRPYLAPGVDDAALCGFGPPPAKVTAALYDDKGELRGRLTLVAGRRTGAETYWSNGKLKSQEEIGDAAEVEREFAQDGTKLHEARWARDGSGRSKEVELEYATSGQLVREQRWQKGELVGERAFYLNGQLKSETKYQRRGTQTTIEVEDFHDNGKPAATVIYAMEGRSGRHPIGTQRRFNQDGSLILARTYDDKGRLTREQEFDARGQVVRDDAVFEDGSRKAFATSPR